jgi:hypothetical protein
MPAASNPGIEVNGVRYAFPTLDTINLDEERILYIYADCVVRDFIPAHPEATEEEKSAYQKLQMLKLRNPDFKRALAHVAYRRRNPGLSDQDIQQAIGTVNAHEADIAMLWGEEEDPQQSSQKQPDDTTSTSEHSRPTDSGSSTTNGSDLPAETPERIGITESVTRSPGARPIELAS